MKSSGDDMFNREVLPIPKFILWTVIIVDTLGFISTCLTIIVTTSKYTNARTWIGVFYSWIIRCTLVIVLDLLVYTCLHKFLGAKLSSKVTTYQLLGNAIYYSFCLVMGLVCIDKVEGGAEIFQEKDREAEFSKFQEEL